MVTRLPHSDLLRTSIVAALALAGCSTSVVDDDAGFGLDFGTSAPSVDDGGDATGGDDGDDASSGPSPDPAADSGPGADDGGPGDSGPGSASVRCDKIDFLFVVESPWSNAADGSWVYYDAYSKLREGFKSLVSELYVSVEVDDFRVLVTSSTPASEEYVCPTELGVECPPEGSLDACDKKLGAGRNGVAIPDWGVTECMPGRFMESGQPEIEGTFACLVQDWWIEDGWWPYYTGAGDDRSMDAMTLALGSEAAPDGCNQGFLREDALLVVVLLEQGGDLQADVSSGTVATWHEAIANAKLGIEDNVVVLGLAPDGTAEQPLCAPSESDDLGEKIHELVDGFPNGKWASSCLPDYVPFFGAAAEVIDAACDDFRPQG